MGQLKSFYLSCICLLLIMAGPVVSAQSLDFQQTNLEQYSHPSEEWTSFLDSKFDQELDLFTTHMDKKRHKFSSEVSFLKYVYYRVHRKYLDHYKTPSTFQELFEDKNYDCLTGTALYALIFERLDIDYQIVETNYHIYLTIQSGDDQILIESTSPLNGFITDPEMVSKTINSFLADENSQWVNKDYYKFNYIVKEKITLKELVGLQYYNLAIASYNQKDLKTALVELARGLKLYPSERLKETMTLMLETLAGDTSIDPLFKHQFLSYYRNLLLPEITASRDR